ARSTTRWIFSSSFIRLVRVWRRPAVSRMAHAIPRARAAWTVSKATAAGSLPGSWRTTSTPIRWPHSASWSLAAARKVSHAPRITFPPPPRRAASLADEGQDLVGRAGALFGRRLPQGVQDGLRPVQPHVRLQQALLQLQEELLIDPAPAAGHRLLQLGDPARAAPGQALAQPIPKTHGVSSSGSGTFKEIRREVPSPSRVAP